MVEAAAAATAPIREQNNNEDALISVSHADDVARYQNEGFLVDDDNDPAPENIAVECNDPTITYDEWGWNGIDYHLQSGNTKLEPNIIDDDHRPIDPNNLLMSLFLLMIPLTYVCQVLIVETNKNLEVPLTLGEFLRFVGLWLLMATTKGNFRAHFWSHDPVDIFQGAPFRLNGFMSGRQFNRILSALAFTDTAPPPYRDKFHKIRQLIVEFNRNMSRVYKAGWILCVDESMSTWYTQWTCPGWMFVPRKPHPFGNEYHVNNCGLWGVMYFIELVEGKDRPQELPPPRFNELGKTVGLVLRMCQPLFATGKCVVMDSGFCVVDALIKLRERGVFASIMVKK